MSTLDPALAETLRARLESRARELSGELAVAHDKWRAGLEAEPGDVVDHKDLAADNARAETDAGEADRDFAELQAVRAALERIDEGRFGDCTDCGEPIAPARLQALPSAARCAACQQRHENTRHAG